MASVCVNNIGISQEKNFLDCSMANYPSYGWPSPRISFSREIPDKEASKVTGAAHSAASENVAVEKPEESDTNISGNDFVDFEFRLEDPINMLPADELFSDGKLVPLHLSTIRHSMRAAPFSSEVKLTDSTKLRRTNENSVTDPYLFSPKAPRCSSRWKELLGLKRISQNSSTKNEESKTTPSLSCKHNKNTARSLKHFLQRSSKSSLNASIDSSLSLPLLKDSDYESVSISSRLSLSSSSSSGHEHDDFPRLSLDSDKPGMSHRNSRNHSRVRVVNAPASRVGRSTMRRAPEATVPARGVSVDSPRMNSSGKIVFQSLERSSSSPSSFNGGPRYKYRGVERSYSANVRITPVLNVPICSLRGSSKSGVFGFPLFSSQQRKEGGCSSNNGCGNRGQSHVKNRTDRI
ncbi:unnamed protein product [Fraxinus pennsylvanica]|uniref:Uncharacterized protein n=1 Tax=Fraxinus pennsylvanica TaxID=56036 RepID=A0AAD2DYU4_9LAMI|nr:unnamed protein product [Fraxinus pennsylvanica]